MNNIIIPKYCDPNSILLINNAGVIKRLHCPFRVECIVDTGIFKQKMWAWVEEVASNPKDELIYWILRKPYLHNHFMINVTF